VVESVSEAFEALRERAHKRFGRIPEGVVAAHVLRVCEGADWPVQRAALEALHRRYAQARAERLALQGRPPRALPAFVATRSTAGKKPYRTLLANLDPPVGSCDCRDYLRSSLGLCKHLLVALESALVRGSVRSSVVTEPRLVWDPVRPMIGAGDWLERVRFEAPRGARLPIDPRSVSTTHVGTPGALPLLAAWFAPDGRLKNAFTEDRERRSALVAALTRFLPTSNASDPALRPLLEEEAGRLQTGSAAAIARLKRKLFPYQRAGVRAFLDRRRLLLADDMGLGKTAQAIAACHALAASGEVARGLLLVPASLKSQWKREWSLFTDLDVTIIEGDAASRAEIYRRTKRGFVIANYEQLLRDHEVVREWKPDLVVLDEAQRIKNWATATARSVKSLAPDWRLVLTGTPMENRLEELASILDWVDDSALEPKWRLHPWHSAWGDGDGEVKGARNLDVLRTRMRGCLLRRVREEVLTQLPARTDVRVPVTMTPEQLEEHDALRRPIADLMNRAKKRPLLQAEFLMLMSLFTKQRMISNALALHRFDEMWPDLQGMQRRDAAAFAGLGSPKLLEFRERAKELLEQGRKAVIFSQWRRMLRLAHWAIEDLLTERGFRPAFFTGAESLNRRTQNIVEFHDDGRVPFLFATDAGGVGLNLQRAASCCVNLELPWNPAVLEQRIGRIHRLGQSRPIEVYDLVCEEGIEARIAATVSGKRALFKGLFDGKSDEVCYEKSGGFLERARELAGVEPPAATDKIETEADEELDPPAEIVAAPEAGIEEKGRDAGRSAGIDLPLTELRGALARIEVRATPGGGLAIEAPPDAARVLAALFSGLASKLEKLAMP